MLQRGKEKTSEVLSQWWQCLTNGASDHRYLAQWGSQHSAADLGVSQ